MKIKIQCDIETKDANGVISCQKGLATVTLVGGLVHDVVGIQLLNNLDENTGKG